MSRENTLRYVILGLLSHKERTGYDIKKCFQQEVGDFWSSRHSQIYPEMLKMEEQGLLASRKAITGQKLEKKYYSLTDAGKKELEEWLQAPLGSIVPTRDDFTIKLYLIDDAADPRIPILFQQEISRHQIHHRHLTERWKELFTDPEERERHYGHALILRQAIDREAQRLAWLKKEYKKLPKK